MNRGDSTAFETLYFRYRDWVVALAARITGNPSTAVDVLQDTFVYFFKKFPGFRLTSQLKTFLFPAVRNLSIAARKKAERCHESDQDLDEFPSKPVSGGSTLDSDLEFVLGRLPEEQREVLLLRFVDGFTLNEVAIALEIPVGTVKSRLHNALNALRNDPRTRELFID